MSVTKLLMDPIDFHCIFFSYGSQWGPSTVWLLTFFKISSFVFSNRKKYIQGFHFQNFRFEVNYSFKQDGGVAKG